MEFPTLWIITKVPIGKFVGICFVLWGADVALMAAAHNFAGLAAIRFFLGIFEAAMLPCMLIINSMWYRKEEQPLRTALWYNTFAGIFGGILSYAIGHIKSSLPTWKVSNSIHSHLTTGALIIPEISLLLYPADPRTLRSVLDHLRHLWLCYCHRRVPSAIRST